MLQISQHIAAQSHPACNNIAAALAAAWMAAWCRVTFQDPLTCVTFSFRVRQKSAQTKATKHSASTGRPLIVSRLCAPVCLGAVTLTRSQVKHRVTDLPRTQEKTRRCTLYCLLKCKLLGEQLKQVCWSLLTLTVLCNAFVNGGQVLSSQN